MAFIHNYSDGVGRPRLASKADLGILESTAAARAAKNSFAKRLDEVIAQRDIEMARKYPDMDYVERCNKIIARLRANVAEYQR